MSNSRRPSLTSGASLFMEVADGEYEYSGPQLCGSIYEFLWECYCFGAYELTMRACEANLAAVDLQEKCCEIFCFYLSIVMGVFKIKVFFIPVCTD